MSGTGDLPDRCESLLAIASEIGEAVPRHLACEIAVTGSVARGVADARSDLELNLWAHHLPPKRGRPAWIAEPEQTAWLQLAGATDLVLDEAVNPDGSIWCTFRFRDVWVELGWQALSDQSQLIADILDAVVLDHERLVLAEVISNATALRTQGEIERWQGCLTHYPDPLARRLVEESAGYWQYPHYLDNCWEPRPGQRLKFAEDLLHDAYRVLRILFAMNRQWEPDFKWLRGAIEPLEVKPSHVVERLNQMLSESPKEARITLFELVSDTLWLASPYFDVGTALSGVDSALRHRGSDNKKTG